MSINRKALFAALALLIPTAAFVATPASATTSSQHKSSHHSSAHKTSTSHHNSTHKKTHNTAS